MTTDPTTPSGDETRARRDAERTAESARLTAELRDSRAGLVEHDRDAAARVGGMLPADPTTTEPAAPDPRSYDHVVARRASEAAGEPVVWRTIDGTPFDPHVLRNQFGTPEPSAPAALDGPGTGGGEFKSSAENLNEAAPSSSRPESPAPSPGTVLGEEEFAVGGKAYYTAMDAAEAEFDRSAAVLPAVHAGIREYADRVASLVRDAEQRGAERRAND